MQSPIARTSRDPQVVQATVGLIEYLRDLAQAGKRTVRDYSKYQDIWWLAELPEGVKTLHEQRGGTLLELQYEPRRPPPDPPALLAGRIDLQHVTDQDSEPRLLMPDLQLGDTLAITDGLPPENDRHQAAFEKWLNIWRLWAKAERQALPRRKLYSDLASAVRKLSQNDDTLEAVLGVGLLCLNSPRGEKIRRHLITVRVDLSIDRTTTTIIVKIPEEAAVRFEDRQFLDSEDGFAADRVEALQAELQSGDIHPLNDRAVEVLEKWHARALDFPARFTRTWERPELDLGSVTALAPALIIRQRDSNLLVECYQRILETLQRPGASAPLGLAQLVFDLEKAERVAWRTSSGQPADLLLGEDPLFPLPANMAQRSVLNRLQHDTAVVVQGPPGTGKTHTIANLLAALLARGKRVLVTSAKDQALSVVRDKLPKPLQELCVQFSYQHSRGTDELERTVSALSDRVSSSDPEQLRLRITRLQEQRTETLKRRASLHDQIFDLRESETVHRSVAVGYEGTRADIVETVRANAARFGWIDPFPDPAPLEPPVTPSEALELADLLKNADSNRLRLRHEFLPAELDLLPARDFIIHVSEAAAEGQRMPTPLGEQLGQLPARRIQIIDRLLHDALNALHRLGLPLRAVHWDEADWRVRALLAALAGRDQALWQNLHQMTHQAAEHHRALSRLGMRRVVVPQLTVDKVTSMVNAAMVLHQYLASETRTWWLRPRTIRNAERILSECTVDGKPPRTLDQSDALLIHLQAQELVVSLDDHWLHTGSKPGSGPLANRLSELCDRAADLSSIRAFSTTVEGVGAILRESRLHHFIHTPQGWDELLENIEWSLDQATARHAVKMLDALNERLTPHLAEAGPELQALREAIRKRDAEAYGHALRDLATAAKRRIEQQRCDQLLDSLRLEHPVLTADLDKSLTNPAWAERLAELSAAWEWGRAAVYCRRLSDPERDQKLMYELEAAEQALEDITAELAAAEAWLWCLARMTQEQRQGLQAYKNRVSDRGKGTSKRYGERHRQGVRDAMSLAQGAVPAWIMPLPLVVETIRHQPDCFDVVIVDEASQMRVDSAFLLWLAPHVIVVGDDQQCAPSAMSYGELKPIHDRIDQYLPGVRPAFRDDFAPTANLYTLLQARFPEVVRLSDHYRCMPEIIGWSSKQFYGDRLVPLRQFGAERLDPLKVVLVEDAYTEGIEDRLRNEVEAEQLVSKLSELFADPRYNGKTFGVIALQSTGQVRVLERLISEKIDAAEAELRKLRVGQPPDFQGDQRDVILLSMVVTDNPRIASSKPQQRRFNVATSRAEDQMWLFTSLPLHRLNPQDLRRSLLTWMMNPVLSEPSQTELGDVHPDIPHPAFDSLFEQRVYLQIQERGYRVVPQMPVGNNKRIDLVVIGMKGRLGVECDGRAWHSTPDQVRADIAREQELRRASWELWRLREGDFYLDPNKALEPLWRELDRRGITPGVVNKKPSGASTWRPIELQNSDEEDDYGAA
ncbi:AAA domain-containing protein [Streptosporangium sp. NBC_01756]|uniref:AAA domain-containing protein n=1 Tax=Streptosporangium sp. NBC_01756 TaxID=2975950 RepID=UPI002DDC89E2|nr:AAA domain-containing protein [Streptosporangium sp. NBC_01756]WSC89437.1 AAA domain-containing protein [Streptosporangium sp. NBC_01756]